MNIKELMDVLIKLPPEMEVWDGQRGQNFEITGVGELPWRISDERLYIDWDWQLEAAPDVKDYIKAHDESSS